MLCVRVLRYALSLLAACGLYAAAPDRAVFAVMRSSASAIDDVRVIKRIAVNAELDLVVAVGAEKNWAAGEGEAVWWGDHTILGILLQHRSRPDLIYKITTSKGEGDCEVRVERATAKDAVLSCTPEKGVPGPNHKFIYDIRSKAFINQVEYEPFSLERIFVSGQEAVLVGSDTRRVVAVKYNPADEPAFHILEDAQAQQWTRRIETSAGTIGFGTNLKQVIYLKPKYFQPVRFGPGNRFTFTQDGERLVVLDQTGKAVKRYALPQSSYDDFARLRPDRVSDGYNRQGTTINEAIGRWQIADGTLWFAKGFYDGEGNTGVGGFGYFDTEQLKYRIFTPREIADWSATAMLVEPEAVWLGVASSGEYRANGGGLLRFVRATQQAERIEFPEIVNEMVRIGNHLLLATNFGAAVLKDRTLRRFFVDQAAEGQLQVSESVFGN